MGVEARRSLDICHSLALPHSRAVKSSVETARIHWDPPEEQAFIRAQVGGVPGGQQGGGIPPGTPPPHARHMGRWESQSPY